MRVHANRIAQLPRCLPSTYHPPYSVTSCSPKRTGIPHDPALYHPHHDALVLPQHPDPGPCLACRAAKLSPAAPSHRTRATLSSAEHPSRNVLIPDGTKSHSLQAVCTSTSPHHPSASHSDFTPPPPSPPTEYVHSSAEARTSSDEQHDPPRPFRHAAHQPAAMPERSGSSGTSTRAQWRGRATGGRAECCEVSGFERWSRPLWALSGSRSSPREQSRARSVFI